MELKLTETAKDKGNHVPSFAGYHLSKIECGKNTKENGKEDGSWHGWVEVVVLESRAAVGGSVGAGVGVGIIATEDGTKVPR
jgi:hypothetical protein